MRKLSYSKEPMYFRVWLEELNQGYDAAKMDKT
jgi:hypothetical protein